MTSKRQRKHKDVDNRMDVDSVRSSPVSLSFTPPDVDPSLPVRLVVMGDHRVGMTSLLRRFNLGLFTPDYVPQAAKVIRHTRTLFHSRRGRDVTVQFSDVEGADVATAFQCALRAHACAVMYDVTNRSSFENAQKYFQFINPRASSLLVGTKIDLSASRRVSYEEGRLLAKIHRVEFIETSAKLNYNVDEALQILISCVPDEYILNITETKQPSRYRGFDMDVCALCRQRLRRHHPVRHTSSGSSYRHSDVTTGSLRHSYCHDDSTSGSFHHSYGSTGDTLSCSLPEPLDEDSISDQCSHVHNARASRSTDSLDLAHKRENVFYI